MFRHTKIHTKIIGSTWLNPPFFGVSPSFKLDSSLLILHVCWSLLPFFDERNGSASAERQDDWWNIFTGGSGTWPWTGQLSIWKVILDVDRMWLMILMIHLNLSGFEKSRIWNCETILTRLRWMCLKIPCLLQEDCISWGFLGIPMIWRKNKSDQRTATYCGSILEPAKKETRCPYYSSTQNGL